MPFISGGGGGGGGVTPPVTITGTAPATVPLTVTGAAGQSTAILNVKAANGDQIIAGYGDSANGLVTAFFGGKNGAGVSVASDEAVTVGGVGSVVEAIGTAFLLSLTNAAPADAALAAGDYALWLDATNGAAKLMVKAKQADGTVVAAAIALA